MDGAADLLVEEDVAREAVDFVVEAEGDLPCDARAVVQFEQRFEVALAARRLGRDDAPVLEAQARVVDLATVEDSRQAEADRAVDACLDWARVDLAVGHVLPPVSRAPGAALDCDREVGVLTHDPQVAHRLELGRARLELLAHAGPVTDWILVVDVAGAEVEVLVLVKRHRGVLRVSLGRAERPAPAMLAARDPVAPADRQLALGSELPLAPVGIGTRERARVRLRPNR